MIHYGPRGGWSVGIGLRQKRVQLLNKDTQQARKAKCNIEQWRRTDEGTVGGDIKSCSHFEEKNNRRLIHLFLPPTVSKQVAGISLAAVLLAYIFGRRRQL